jgi:hypothetical protein
MNQHDQIQLGINAAVTLIWLICVRRAFILDEMKRCYITLPRNSEGLEEAIRKGMEGNRVELTFDIGDVDTATVAHCEITPQHESATEGGQEVGTEAMCYSVGQKITQIEQKWRGES